jgi:hypothetical protein
MYTNLQGSLIMHSFELCFASTECLHYGESVASGAKIICTDHPVANLISKVRLAITNSGQLNYFELQDNAGINYGPHPELVTQTVSLSNILTGVHFFFVPVALNLSNRNLGGIEGAQFLYSSCPAVYCPNNQLW